MRQPAFVALVASAFVLYLVALAGAGGALLDGGSVLLSCAAVWSALVPLGIRSDEQSHPQQLVRALAALLALSMASYLAIAVHSLLGELLFVISLPALSVVTLELSLFAPDTPPKLSRHIASVALVRLLGLVAVVLAVLSALPPFWLFGRALILPYWLFQAPLVFALSAFVLAGALRLFRRRLGSDTQALSANVWPTLGLAAALLCACVLALLGWLGALDQREAHACVAVASLLLLTGHVWLVSTRRAKVAHAWARELFALLLAFAMAGAVSAWLARYAQAGALQTTACLLLGLLTFELSKLAFRRVARLLLAPQRGELLRAIAEIRTSSASAQTYLELSANVLRPLRRAAGSPEAAPLLYSFHPVEELRLDAAGFARSSSRSLSPALLKRLESAPDAPIVRDDLRQKLSRRPELREVVWALDELSALCVLPLVTDGNLDGALVVAQGSRKDPLSLEELDQLIALTRFMAPLLAVMSMVERMRVRLSEQDHERKQLAEKLRDVDDELRDARATVSLLKTATAPLLSGREPIRYSPAMRELVNQLYGAYEITVCLVAEAGSALLPLAELLHRTGGRAPGPLVAVDCSAIDPVEASAKLFGTAADGAPRLGLLQLAEGGTLLLTDVAALPNDSQQALGRALSERRACPVGSSAAYNVDVRVVATVRRPVEDLVAAHALATELARWFSPASYVVPPLRACREDIESLALLALDRASRVLGKSVPGLSREALAALQEYDFPLNHQELDNVVERALGNAAGARIELSDLPPLPKGTMVAGSFVEQERDILRRALDQAGGNRTRAARALGLKRTTLIEKLRKLGIDEGRSGTEH